MVRRINENKNTMTDPSEYAKSLASQLKKPKPSLEEIERMSKEAQSNLENSGFHEKTKKSEPKFVKYSTMIRPEYKRQIDQLHANRGMKKNDVMDMILTYYFENHKEE